MPSFYFDIETVSKDPATPRHNIEDPSKSKIITIQFQKFGSQTGDALGELNILKEWEAGERKILKKVKEKFLGGNTWREDFEEDKWDFIPFGTNLYYEFWFLQQKFREYFGLEFSIKLMKEKPKFDLKSFLVMANKGKFKGSSLHNFSSKIHGGGKIHEWYYDENFGKIISYIRKEADAFRKVYSKLIDIIPCTLKS